MAKEKAVFLDRDGTIIQDRGHLSDLSEVIFIDGCFEALRMLEEQYLLFIVTNQCGIAEGLVRPEQAQKVNDHVVKCLSREGVEIAEVYTCPHKRSDGCECIKPNPYFLKIAERDWELDLNASFVIGDHPHDYFFGENAGAKGIYVLTGHGRKHLEQLPVGKTVVEDIVAAAEIILTTGGGDIASQGSITDINICR